MIEYIPDKWVVIKIKIKDTITHKVFANWYGGWTGSDSWKLNSGITKIEEDGQCYLFHGYSGSVYRCHKNNYGTNLYGSGVLNNLIENMEKRQAEITVLPEETNFLEINYECA